MVIKELKITVSFKAKEIELYNYIKKQRSPSNFIKDAIEYYIKNHDKNTEDKEDNNINLIDF